MIKIVDFIKISDETLWAFPAVLPEGGGVSWMLRHTTWTPTKEERLALAAMLDSYKALVYATGKKRALVVRDIKEARKTRKAEDTHD